ncbi:hypothetical protein Droror1_Dr00013682 [Drosera rotundifolia]
MADIDESTTAPPPPSAEDNLSAKFEKLSVASPFTIWPPTQRTRDAVINRLIETLSQPSILSKRYGSLPHDEASAAARAIEEEAFVAASAAGGDAASVDEGMEILQAYSKEISKRMLEKVKSKGGVASTPVETTAAEDPAATPAAEVEAAEEKEEASAAAEQESSQE